MSGKKKRKKKETNPECLLTQESIIPYPLHAYIRIDKTTKNYAIETPYLSISEKLTRVYNQLIIQCNKKKIKLHKIKLWFVIDETHSRIKILFYMKKKGIKILFCMKNMADHFA